MEFAEHEFRNARPMGDGATEGDHLASGARQLAMLPGRAKAPPPVPEGPPFPEELDFLWTWFRELSQGLVHNGMMQPTVTWEAIRAWQLACDIGPIEPWEARTLVQLGLLRANILAEKAEADRKKPGS